MKKLNDMREEERLTLLSIPVHRDYQMQFLVNNSRIKQVFARISLLSIFAAFACMAPLAFSQGGPPTPPPNPPPPPPSPPQPVVPNYQNTSSWNASCAIASGADIISYFAANGYPSLMPAGTSVSDLENSLNSLNIGTDPQTALTTWINNHGDGLNVSSINPLCFLAMSSVFSKGGLIYLGLGSPGLPARAVVAENSISGGTPYVGISDINPPPTTDNPVTAADYSSTGDFACAVTGKDSKGNATTVQYYRVEYNDPNQGQFWFWYRGTDTWHRYDVNVMIAITPIPEPSALALLGLGTISLAAYTRWRRKAKA